MKFTLLIIFLLFSSCSLIINSHDQKEYFTLKEVKKNTVCLKPENNDITTSENLSVIDSYEHFLSSLRQNNIYFNPISRFLAYSLIQMSARPDLASPTSQLQILLTYNQKPYFYEFQTKEASSKKPKINMPMLYGLHYIQKKFKANKSLTEISFYLDRYLKKKIKVDLNLTNALKKKRNKLYEYPSFKKYFFRGKTILNENESLNHYSFNKTIKLYNASQSKSLTQINDQLQKAKNYPGLSCNFSMENYEKSQYTIYENEKESLSYSFQSKNFSALVSTSQQMNSIKPLGRSPYFQGDSRISSNNFCLFIDESRSLLINSSKSRDPRQVLFNLIKNDILNTHSIKEVEQLIKFSRYLFLIKPVRLFYESNRGNTSQLNELLKLNIPIFHSNSIGQVWGLYNDQKNHYSFIDERKEGHLSCQNRK